MIDDITHELAETLKELRTKFDSRQHLSPSMVRVDAALELYEDACKTPEKPEMKINLKDYANKLVVVTLRNELMLVGLVTNNTDYSDYSYNFDDRYYTRDGLVLIDKENPHDIIDIVLADGEPCEASKPSMTNCVVEGEPPNGCSAWNVWFNKFGSRGILNNLKISSLNDKPEPVITRVEVITHEEGRVYVNWKEDNKITTSLQDDGKTLKIFVNKQEPKMPITKPLFYTNLSGEFKTMYNVAEKEVSKQWANALSVLIEELSPLGSLSLWGYEGKTPTPEKVVEYLRGLIKHREQRATDAVEEVSKPEFTIEPEAIDDLWNTAANYKKFANDIAELMCCSTKVKVSNYWATALSNFIDELGGDSPALWEWKGITPTPEKVVECLRELVDFHMTIAADNELDECVDWVSKYCPYLGDFPMPEDKLREYRRPQPTLKSQALRDFETVRRHSDLLPEILDTIENALKSIPE